MKKHGNYRDDFMIKRIDVIEEPKQQTLIILDLLSYLIKKDNYQFKDNTKTLLKLLPYAMQGLIINIQYTSNIRLLNNYESYLKGDIININFYNIPYVIFTTINNQTFKIKLTKHILKKIRLLNKQK